MTELLLPLEQMTALDATIQRGREIVDPRLLELAQACIDHVLAGSATPQPVDERERDVIALIEQVLIDVANLQDETVQRADRHFDPGGLADLVMTSYALEARTRLNLATAQLGSTS